MAAAIFARVGGTTATKGRRMLLWLVIIAVISIPECRCIVACNEYDTCLPPEKQMNLTDSIRDGNSRQVCILVSWAMECLEEARRDCDDARYKNLPGYIVKELDDKRNNMAIYKTTYCGSNGGDVRGVSMAATVGWTMLLSAFLYGQ